MASNVEVREIPVIGDSLVVVGSDILEEIPARLECTGMKPAVFVVISDTNVFSHYGERLVAVLTSAAAFRGSRVIEFVIKPGEASKSRAVKESIEDFMMENKCNRDTVVVALGGGVVGDLSGFVAATYMRGVPVVQVPTSVMAMVDSSVGGKTAINVPAGKNLIGAFHQPRLVFADMSLLNTLARREVAEGLAEAIKMGVIRDEFLFDLMEREYSKAIALDPEIIAKVIYTSVNHKAKIVALDEKETGLRSTLNYGHTIGHAIEALMSPKFLHGECVAIGCVLEADLACRMGKIQRNVVQRIRNCFESYSLPVALPELPAEVGLADFMAKMALDKKNSGGSIRCTIITSIGSSLDHPMPVPRDLMEDVLKDAIAEITNIPAAKRPKH